MSSSNLLKIRDYLGTNKDDNLNNLLRAVKLMHWDNVQDSLRIFKGLVDIIVENSTFYHSTVNLRVVLREDKPLIGEDYL